MATRKTGKSQTKRTSGTGLNGPSKEPLSTPDAGPGVKADSRLSVPDAPSAAKAELPLSAPAPRPAVKADSPSLEQIRLRAYEIFMARGGINGNDVSDWLEAERQLLRDSGSRSD